MPINPATHASASAAARHRRAKHSHVWCGQVISDLQRNLQAPGTAKPHGQDKLTTSYSYDMGGQLLTAANAHSKIALGYDMAGQLTEETLTAAEWSLSSVPRPVDLRAGQRAGERAGERGHLIRQARAHTLKHEYDLLGNRIATTLPDGRILNTLTYGSGHVHQINLDGELISDFKRDALHRETARSQGGLWQQTQYDSAGRVTRQQAHVYDKGLQALQRNVAAPGTATPLVGLGLGKQISRSYLYDPKGQLTAVNDWRTSSHYQYDALGQLLSATAGHSEERFSFDPAHNLLPAHGDKAVHQNRVTVYEDMRFEYDRQGRTIRKKTGKHTELQLSWDAEHQLSQATTIRTSTANAYAKPSTTRQTTHYTYDPFGRRLSKQNQFGTTWFTWDGNRLLQEHTPNHNRTYIYQPSSFVPLAQVDVATHRAVAATATAEASSGQPPDTRELHLPFHPATGDDIAYTHWREPGTGRVLPLPEQNPQNKEDPSQRSDEQRLAANDPFPPSHTPRIRYYHTDQIGTPRELTEATGEIVWQASYRAWGNTATVEWVQGEQAFSQEAAHLKAQATQTAQMKAQAQALSQPLRFQGQYFDAETGLHYNRFRYYDPDIGRFATHDPIGLFGGVNTFQYTPNPTGWVDPLGLAGYEAKMGNISGDDTLSRGVHINVQGPGLPKSGGHVGIVPTQDGKGLTTSPVDAATSKLPDSQRGKVCSCVVDFINKPKNHSKIAKQAQAGMDKFPGTERARQLKTIRDLANQGVLVK